MCLITEQRTPYVADTDIPCYKILRVDSEDICFAPFHIGWKYNIDTVKEYKAEFTGELGEVVHYTCNIPRYKLSGGGVTEEEASLMKPESVLYAVTMINDIESSKLHYHGQSPSHENLLFEGAKNLREEIVSDLYSISEGLHTYTHYMNGSMVSLILKISEQMCYEKICVAKFIIPKGTRYYVSHDGECFVSEKIVFGSVISKEYIDRHSINLDFNFGY